MCIGGPNDTRKMSRGFLSHVYAWPLNARRIDPDGGATVVHCMAMLQLRHGWMLFTPPYTPATSAPGLAQPGHICTGTGPARPQLHQMYQDWPTPATSAPGLGAAGRTDCFVCALYQYLRLSGAVYLQHPPGPM